MSQIKIALLDMNNNQPNQGMKNITELSNHFKQNSQHKVSITHFDVRPRNEVPNAVDFDIFISSGGPGNPHKEGLEWEDKFAKLLDDIWKYNIENGTKKYLFLVCHSFQLACIHWDLATVNQRKSYSFGVMPMHKTKVGKKDYLFKNLPEPFYAVDSRAYQVIEANQENFRKINAEIMAIEKDRPKIKLERAIMAIRFSEEIFGTQFHPEANPEGMLENFKIEKNKQILIDNYGIEKYLETVNRIDDEDKIVLTQAQILPRFLALAVDQITNQYSLC